MVDIDWSKAPEGATHYLKDSPQPWRDLSGDNWLWFWQGQWHGEGEKSILNNTSEQLIRSQGNNLVRRPRSPALWNGKAPAPAGTLCNLKTEQGTMHEAEIMYSSQTAVVWRWKGRTEEFGSEWNFVEVTPIRTAEQIAAEDRTALELAACSDIEGELERFNVTLECSAAIRATINSMLAAGYRK